jgi:flavin-dependent dehydrogenase
MKSSGNMEKFISNIVIVGGGTAGWITAGTLAAKFKKDRKSGFKITLVESPDVPIIGVGEGTWPTMRRTLRNMGIRETEFIKKCNVSFKQGAKFAKWVTGDEDDAYYHPLVVPQDFDHTNLADAWHSQEQLKSFSNTVCSQEQICEHNKAPKLISTPEYAGIANYAYHLDAGAFSQFLQAHCVDKLDVEHVLDHVTKINNHKSGDISSVSTENHGDISGDLFVDCTGFKSLLLGENQNVAFKSCSEILFVDKALAVHVPYQDQKSEIASHTISTAQSAGWIWDIGLPTRRGVGHVFSSKYTDTATAKQALKSYIEPTYANVEDLTIREIDINAGHREIFWKRNCVAVGLSAGFLEPLEASALLLVEISAEMISEQLPATRCSMDIVSKRFNKTFLYRWSCIIDFLKLHYMLNQRNDNQFWIDHRDPKTIPDSLKELLALWKYKSPWHEDFEYAREVFPAASYQYVLYGMGFKTNTTQFDFSEQYLSKANTLINKNQIETQKLLTTLPSNRELLSKIAQFGMQTI